MNGELPGKPEPEKTLTSAEETHARGGGIVAAAVPLPKRIGRYHVKRIIASGGMGTVFEATQDNPRRVVAVKVLKHGIASRSALRRFEYEAQLLARLHHPGIAQIYEAGTHDDGSGPVPYFAMEYIPAARPITAYVQEKKLGTRARLELLAKVCDAVHHGHQKGIIHRDLKPGNILVDAQGDVKIIDFGVARGTDSDLAVTTLQTDIGQLVGTLQYMSPEQCAADPHDIDVRSDVYALGVLLYELLAGKPPYDLRGKPMHESTRVIREQEPGRLSTSDRTLRGDVETIASKALEKDRERRYQSALELAQDIRHYLAGEAIVARPPSIVYQFRIFARRHKALFGAMAAVFVVLLAATIVSTTLYVRAERARRDTVAVRNFLQAMIASVDTADPQPALQRSSAAELTVREMLTDAKDRVQGYFAAQPELEAEIRDTLTTAFTEVGDWGEAELQAREVVRLRSQCLGPEHLATLRAKAHLATTLSYRGNLAEALTLQQAAYSAFRRERGPDSPETLVHGTRLIGQLAGANRLAEAETLAREILSLMERAGPVREESIPGGDRLLMTRAHVQARVDLADVVISQGRLHEGERLAREALATGTRLLGAHYFTTSNAKSLLGGALHEQGRYAEAQAVLEEYSDDYRSLCGASHPWTMYSVANLMLTVAYAGDPKRAEETLRSAIPVISSQLGESGSGAASAATQLAIVLNLERKFAEAEASAREAVAKMTSVADGATLELSQARDTLVIALYGQQRAAEAEQNAREVVQWVEQQFPNGRYYLLPQFRCHWGQCLTALGDYDEAEKQLKLAYDGEMAMRGPQHRNTREVVDSLVRFYEARGQPDEAAKWRTK